MKLLKSKVGFALPLIITVIPLVLALLVGIPFAIQIITNKWLVVLIVLIAAIILLRKR